MNNLQVYLDDALKQVKLDKKDDTPIKTDYDIFFEVCQLIIAARKELGITQKQLAQKSGVSQSNISKIENGSYYPSIATVKRIADSLNKRLVIDFVDREDYWDGSVN